MRAFALAPFATVLALGALLVAACGPSSSHDCTVCGDNSCVDVETDSANCGGCGIVCPGGDVCSAGDCIPDPGQRCNPGEVADCYDGAAGTEGVGPCTGGQKTCNDTGYWGACEGEVTPTAQICNSGGDQDCDGQVDEETDNDGDGYTNCTGDCCDSTQEGCASPERVNPGAFEAPGNNLDDDCDGQVDNASTATCDSGLASDTQVAMDFAKAIDLCQESTGGHWGVVSARFLKADGTGTPLASQHSVRPGFGATQVQLGQSLAVLSTGTAAAQNSTGLPSWTTFQSTDNSSSSGFPSDFVSAHGGTLPNAPDCPAPLMDAANDPMELELKIKVPTNAQSFSMKVNFMSAEFPEWVCTQYNDFFVVLLDSTWAGSPANPADKNLAFYKDPSNNIYPVGVNLGHGNTGLFTACHNGQTGCDGLPPITDNITTCTNGAELANTGMDISDTGCGSGDQVGGGTGWLVTSGNVTPGEQITLRIAIWDTSDGLYDSVALIDDFQWSLDPSDPGTIIVN